MIVAINNHLKFWGETTEMPYLYFRFIPYDQCPLLFFIYNLAFKQQVSRSPEIEPALHTVHTLCTRYCVE